MVVGRTFVSEVRAALRDAAVPEDAAPMQAYMKSEMPFLGVKKTLRTQALRPLFAALPVLPWEDVRDTTLELWRKAAFREERYAALAFVRRPPHPKKYFVRAALPMFEEMIVSGAWWDYVDEIAAHCVGAILRRDPTIAKEMRRWSTCDDLWKRRTSILCQLRFKEATDRKLLEACMAPSIDSKEFFLRKAIGWALRDLSRFHPDWVVAYVKKHESRLSGLSRLEALRNLDPHTHKK